MSVNGNESYPPDKFFKKGETLVYQGKYKDAIHEFKKSIKKNPQYYNGYAIIGSLYAGMGSFEESLGWFDQALKRYPEGADLWYNKALSLKKLLRFGEARQAVDKCIALNSEHFAALTVKGLLYITSGDVKNALSCFDKALEINPEYDVAWKNKNSILEKLEQAQEIEGFKDDILKEKYGIHLVNIPEWEHQGLIFLKLGKMVELTPDITHERVQFVIAQYKLSPNSVYIIPTLEHDVLLAIEQIQGAFDKFQKKFNVKAIVLKN